MNDRGPIEDRRSFLKRASVAALAFPLLLSCKAETLGQKSGDGAGESELDLIRKNARRGGEGYGAVEAPDNVSWKTALAKKTERDEPMIISGTVYQSDGKTATSNILIYFYHTDAAGIYGRAGEPKHGHFRGWLLTDARGRYEFSSIRPASYPNTTFAAHVHMTLTGKNFKEDTIDSILFEGDRFLTQQERNEAGRKGGFNPILRLEKDASGIWRGARDIRLWQA